MRSGPFSFGTIILGIGALLLFAFLTVGWLLPSTWSARSARVISAPPEAIYALLDAPEGWRTWTPWPDSVDVTGPERGVGAHMSWNNLDVGNGTFEITEATSPTLVRYHVTVQDTAMTTEGQVRLTPTPNGTNVEWQEDGDFGWNPLMGYWALLMDGVQAREMDRNLESLEAAVKRTQNAPAVTN